MVDFGLNFTQFERSGVEVASLYPPEHHNFDPDSSLRQGEGEFVRGPKDSQSVLVLFGENAELVAHLVEFIATEHVEFIALPHENAKQAAVAVDAVVVLVLDALYLLLVCAHEDAVLYRVARQVHGCLLGVPLRPLQEPAAALLDVGLGLLALLLQPQLVLELKPLVLFLEGSLHLEIVDASLIQNGDQFFGLAQVGDRELQVEVFPHA